MTIRRTVLAMLALCVWSPVWAQSGDPALRNWRRRRPQVARIEIEGNHALSAGDIRRAMQIRTAGFWESLGLKDRPRLLVGAEERDEDAIRYLYRRRGYWDAEAAISVVPDEHSNRARVTVFIAEGRQYHWGGPILEGDHDVLVERGRRFLRALKRGSPADSLALVFATARMRADAANRGHPHAHVEVRILRDYDTLHPALTLRAGRKVLFGNLRVDGAVRTREEFIRREVKWEPGTLYSQRLLADKQFDVYATGLFTFVRLDPVGIDSADTGAYDRADFGLRVVERKPSFIGLRTGTGQDPDRDLTWDYALEWGSRNWFGTGRKWSLTAESGFVVITDWRALHHRFAASYTEPRVFNLRLPTTLTLAFEPGVHSAKQDYSVERFSGELNVTRRIRRIARWRSTLVYERINIFGIDADSTETFLRDKGISVKRRWSLVYERDSRKSVFAPRSGSRTLVDLEYVGGLLGGASDFYKVDMSWARYQLVGPPTVLATRLRFAWAKTHSGGGFVPSIDRFYMGGANTIRGYAENTVGPVDETGRAEGGQVMVLANAELRTPVVWKFWFSMFGDMGNNWEFFRDVSLDDLLVSVGLGWHYMAPVGPIRLDYARRVIHPGYPASDRVHLSILFSF